VGLRRGDWELAVVTALSPQHLIGVELGSKPRFEMFIYVDDPDGQVEPMWGPGVQVEPMWGPGMSVLREAADMFWGERVARLVDPDGNPVALAAGAGHARIAAD
jgi:lactoylglutathione lyase